MGRRRAAGRDLGGGRRAARRLGRRHAAAGRLDRSGLLLNISKIPFVFSARRKARCFLGSPSRNQRRGRRSIMTPIPSSLEQQQRFIGLDLFHAPEDLGESAVRQADNLYVDGGVFVTRPGLQGMFAAPLGSALHAPLAFVRTDGGREILFVSGGNLYRTVKGSAAWTKIQIGDTTDFTLSGARGADGACRQIRLLDRRRGGDAVVPNQSGSDARRDRGDHAQSARHSRFGQSHQRRDREFRKHVGVERAAGRLDRAAAHEYELRDEQRRRLGVRDRNGRRSARTPTLSWPVIWARP